MQGESWSEEHDVIMRVLALRKAGKIGIVLAEYGRYWIALDPYNPWGSKVRYTLAELKELVVMLEGSQTVHKEPGLSNTVGAGSSAENTRQRSA